MMTFNIAYVAVVIIIVPTYISGAEEGQCLARQSALPKKQPIYLTQTGKLHTPCGSTFIWKIGDVIKIACTGPSNSVTKSNTSVVDIKCTENNKFEVGEKLYSLSEISCKFLAESTVESTSRSCANGGKQKLIGFKSDGLKFIDYINLCYDEEAASIIYTYYTIRGGAIGFSKLGGSRPGFKAEGMPEGTDPKRAYEIKSQKERLTQLLGSTTEARKYIKKSSFFARGHLTPDADSIFQTWRKSTYFFINVAPEWQTVNNGNWKSLEGIARKSAEAFNDNLKVFTGVAGILSLKNTNNIQVNITLESNNKIPVPKWFWKILIHKTRGIGFITFNNPFEKAENICKSICEEYFWPNKKFDNFESGQTFCCTIEDILKVINIEVPIPKNVKYIMAYPVAYRKKKNKNKRQKGRKWMRMDE